MTTFLKCKTCGNALNRGKIYCSLKCYWKKSPKFKVKCRQCKKEFLTYPSWQKIGQGFLCSKKCKYKWISENYRGEKSKAGWRNAKIKLECKECNKVFYEFRSRVKDKRGVFCSKKCSIEWFKKNCQMEKAPNWIDGRSYLKYPKEFDIVKNEIKQRDGYLCQLCYIPCIRKRLGAHHIDYNKMNNNKNNLISLCTGCNSKVNRSRDYWTNYFNIKITQ